MHSFFNGIRRLTAAMLLVAALASGAAAPARAQQPGLGTQRVMGDGVNTVLCFATVLDGDTIPYKQLKPVRIIRKWNLLTEKEIRKNQKLIRNVKKTLPYAKEARRRLQELDKQLASMPPAKRKEYTKRVEREVLDEFRDDLEHLTFSQGKVLLKLVDRETGSNSYALIADLRGRMRASFYNTFARMFGFNMKEQYDPKHNKDDNLIERVARSVELGKL